MKNKTVILFLAVVFFSPVKLALAVETMNTVQKIKVRLGYKMPLDPLQIGTMADYDMALVLTDTWFGYDSARRAKANIISGWSFDKIKGVYTFKIDDKRKWSDGSAITADQLVWNLNRAVAIKSNYGLAIAALIDLKNIKINDPLSFSIKVLDGKASDLFFQRMGAQGLAVIHPDDVDKNTFKVISNKYSAGPYYIEKTGEAELILKQNPHVPQVDSKIAKEIEIKRVDPQFSLDQFIEGSTWENIVQVNTFLPEPLVQKLRDSHLPYWTRGHDRVSLLKPTNISRLAELKKFVLLVGSTLDKKEFGKLPLNSKRAQSLQPFGYPLFKEVIYKKATLPADIRGKEFKILVSKGASGETHMALLNPIFSEIGIKIIWDVRPREEFIKQLFGKVDADFILFDFGVADPEPSTWMTVVMENEFVQASGLEKKEFSQITNETNHDRAVRRYKSLLEKIALEGGYLPLFHFSTLSIGSRFLNFDRIQGLDETVNYSKVTFKEP